MLKEEMREINKGDMKSFDAVARRQMVATDGETGRG